MAAKKEPGLTWRHTTVLVRADIFEQARETGLDISDTCNRALADMLGIDYRQQRLDDVPVPPPVIIAKEGGLPITVPPVPASPEPHRHPVINADDPTAAGAIARGRKQPIKKPVADTTPKKEKPAEYPVQEPPLNMPGAHAATKPKKTPRKKAEPGDGLKKFIAAKIVRDDADDAVVPKEELYQIFSRWCRDHKVSPVPDAKSVAVTLKTRFAFKEKVSGGLPCWVSVRVQ